MYETAANVFYTALEAVGVKTDVDTNRYEISVASKNNGTDSVVDFMF